VALLKRGPAPALATGVSIVGTVLAAQAPELLLSRPSWLDEAGNSLPSGHVAAIAALTVGAAAASPATMHAAVVIVGSVAVALTGVATARVQASSNRHQRRTSRPHSARIKAPKRTHVAHEHQ